MGFRHVYRPGGPHTGLSQGCVLANGTHCGNGERNVASRMGKAGGASEGPGPARGAACGPVLSMTSPTTTCFRLYDILKKTKPQRPGDGTGRCLLGSGVRGGCGGEERAVSPARVRPEWEGGDLGMATAGYERSVDRFYPRKAFRHVVSLILADGPVRNGLLVSPLCR